MNSKHGILDHIRGCGIYYASFVATGSFIYWIISSYNLRPRSDGTSGLGDLQEIMLGISALTIPLLISYLMHPHTGLYEFLAKHVKNRLGGFGIYTNDIREISASLAQETSTATQNVKICIWLLEHHIHEASELDLNDTAKNWLLDSKGKSDHNLFKMGDDRRMITFVVTILALCMILTFSSLCLGIFLKIERQDFIGETSAILSLVSNLFAYAVLLRYVNARQNLKSNALRIINTNFVDISAEFRKLKDNLIKIEEQALKTIQAELEAIKNNLPAKAKPRVSII